MRYQILVLALITGIISTNVVNANKDIEYKTYLTREVLNNQPTIQATSEFDCNDRIYLVVEAIGLTEKDHQLTVKWNNPSDQQQEKTDYSFHGLPYTRIWAWLQLNGPPGAFIGQAFDPSFGMEEFIGKWHAQIAIDQKNIETVEFNVLC